MDILVPLNIQILGFPESGELLLRDLEGDGVMGILVPIDIQILDVPNRRRAAPEGP